MWSVCFICLRLAIDKTWIPRVLNLGLRPLTRTEKNVPISSFPSCLRNSEVGYRRKFLLAGQTVRSDPKLLKGVPSGYGWMTSSLCTYRSSL